jgi:hypothetical protein
VWQLQLTKEVKVQKQQQRPQADVQRKGPQVHYAVANVVVVEVVEEEVVVVVEAERW